ncbi:hypothetical protein LBMAG42_18620 [Deltaproteobacteria bacterium]|nr:hypothetical protein LBMAG42_18620 [Deltaproteobacteria bacterium]
MIAILAFACSVAAEEPASVTPFMPTPVEAPAPPPRPAIREPTDYHASRALSGSARTALSAKRKPTVEALFSAAGVTFPPQSVLLRVFKAQGELEVWAGNAGPLAQIATWGICAQSGELGPKRYEGDQQVPEGFYTIDLFNPVSDYHLSMRVSYPNAADRHFSDPKRPGGAIMIHGSCVSIGCLAMSDERIEELWQIASAVREQKRTVQVHIFPSRDMPKLIASNEFPQHNAFWETLAAGEAKFRETRVIPTIKVSSAGVYEVK